MCVHVLVCACVRGCVCMCSSVYVVYVCVCVVCVVFVFACVRACVRARAVCKCALHICVLNCLRIVTELAYHRIAGSSTPTLSEHAVRFTMVSSLSLLPHVRTHTRTHARTHVCAT